MLLKNQKFKKNDIDEVIMGQVLTGGSGQNPARQAAIKSGIPKEKPAYIVNQVCGSGIKICCIWFSKYKIRRLKNYYCWWSRKYVFSSSCIHLRDGKKLGDAELIDTMIKDGLWDAFHGYHMGVTAENVAEKFQITREEQDKFALKSQEKALKLKNKINLKMK